MFAVSHKGGARRQEERISLALLVDGENIPAKYMCDVLEMSNMLGDCHTRNIYGNSNLLYSRNWMAASTKLHMTSVPTRIATGKNAADKEMVRGAMELLHSGYRDYGEYGDYGDYDGFVICSSDKDFTWLCEDLVKAGKFVVGIGFCHARRSLRNACDMFLEVENLNAIEYKLSAARLAVPILNSIESEWKTGREEVSIPYDDPPVSIPYDRTEYGGPWITAW